MFAIMALEEAGPNSELAWLFYLFLAFFLLMVIVGWWASRRGGIPPEATPEMHAYPDEHATTDELSAHEGGDQPS